jgi:hypothetical protein
MASKLLAIDDAARIAPTGLSYSGLSHPEKPASTPSFSAPRSIQGSFSQLIEVSERCQAPEHALLLEFVRTAVVEPLCGAQKV